MSKPIDQEVILQAILESSSQIKELTVQVSNLSNRIDNVSNRLDGVSNRLDQLEIKVDGNHKETMDRLDAVENRLNDAIHDVDVKFTILHGELFNVKADVVKLQQAE